MNIANIKNSNVENITSIECFDKLSKIPKSFLIDVRTKPEWDFIGLPNLSSINKNVTLISWQTYPRMTINSLFEQEVIKSNIEKPIFQSCKFFIFKWLS